MADADEKPKTARRNTSGAASRRSGNSRASSPNPGLSRLISGRHLDDHAQYHGAGYRGEQHDDAVFDDDDDDDDDSSDGADLTEKDTDDTGEVGPESSGEIVSEVRDGIEDERDLEAGPKLEKSRTTRSARDPNLVTWTGPEDPDNPKNWTMRRKWAATLVGR